MPPNSHARNAPGLRSKPPVPDGKKSPEIKLNGDASPVKLDTTADVEAAIKVKQREFGALRGKPCYPLLLRSASIGPSLVDGVFDDLRAQYSDCDSLDVILDSGGGDIDAAFNIATLLRKRCQKRLTFIIPRWAKSAATLLACAGDEILMSPVAELGPLDPQITQMSPIENRVERFSPLHIESTLQLIRDEYANGHEKLAEGLLQRLQFPLTLGSFTKSMELAETYLTRLLSTRMLKGQDNKVSETARKLTRGYVDHGFCIKVDEARDELGLNANELDGEPLNIVWSIHKLNRRFDELKRAEKQKKLRDQLKNLPPDLLDSLPPELLNSKEDGRHDENGVIQG